MKENMCEFCKISEQKQGFKNMAEYGIVRLIKNMGTYCLIAYNSCDEYGECRAYINFCPMCGRDLRKENP